MRDAKGRYVKGFCGNPKGRPPVKKVMLHEYDYRNELFEATEEILTVNINGKSEKTKAITLIHKQLVRKAALGDRPCMMKTIELLERYSDAALKERLELAGEYLDTMYQYRDRMDDMPQALWETMLKTKTIIGDLLASGE